MYRIICETYSMGSEGSFDLDKEFNTWKEAKRYLRLKYGKIEPFTHNWNNEKGFWYSLLSYSFPKKFFCIYYEE